jgi:hypothetical protein
MANVLTNLIPDFYAALNVVSRELVGFIPAVTRDGQLTRAALNQIIRSPRAPAGVVSDITPGQLPPNDGAQTIVNRTLSITKSRRVPFLWNGEEARGLNNGGPGVLTIQQNQIAEAIRALTNEAEADLAALHAFASRAYGTAGATPFATAGDWTDASNTLKVLKDNGAPQSDLQMVIGTTAGASMIGKQAQVQMTGERNMLTQGIIENRAGFSIRESGAVVNFTKGTNNGAAATNAAGYAVGATVITLGAAGTGNLLAGDVVTFAGDLNKYVLEVGDSDVSNGGTITLRAPGLRVAIPAQATVITTVGSSARNMAFRRSALHLIHRLPALPPGGQDMAVDRTTVQDAASGLVFELSAYPRYREMQYELSAAWGVGCTNDEHVALLLG